MDFSGLATIRKAIAAFIASFATTFGTFLATDVATLQNGLVAGAGALVTAVVVYLTKNADSVRDQVKKRL